MRYFLKFSYNGESFHGWQRQPNAISVQQCLEEALGTVMRREVAVTGAGRTDAGVHARVMYAHFDTDCRIQDKSRFLLSLNRLVGKNICIRDVIDVHDDAHARFDAIEREYKYFITFEKSAFLYPYAWYCPVRLDKQKMNEACELLLETRDFTSFAKLHSDVKTNICDVRRALWTPMRECENGLALPEDGLVFTIAADRFLRNMVRAVVGTLVEVGRGKLDKDGFQRVINEQNRCSAGASMPAQALFLWDVRYSYITSE